MNSPFSLLRHLRFPALLVAVAAATPVNAVVFTDFFEDANHLSFDFSGKGFYQDAASGLRLTDFFMPTATDDLVGLPPLVHWHLPASSWGYLILEGPTPAESSFEVSLSSQHLPDGPVVNVGEDDTGIVVTHFGSNLSTTTSIAHGAELDTYSFTMTVEPYLENGKTFIGAFSGTFSAVHSSGSASVPDSAPAGLMLGGAAVGLAAWQRKARRSQPGKEAIAA